MQMRPSQTFWRGRDVDSHLRSLFVGFVFFLSFGVTSSFAASVILEWDRNPEPDVVGYRVYYGSQSGAYSNNVDAGNNARVTLGNLSDATGYYFAVTALSNTGLESGYSNEVFYVTPSRSRSRAPKNKRPRAGRQTFEMPQDTVYSGYLQATDPNGDPLTFTIVKQSRKGFAQIADPATGAFIYTPFAGVTGRDIFRFRADDGSALSNVGTVRIKILPPTLIPSARSRSAPVTRSAFARPTTVVPARDTGARGKVSLLEGAKEMVEPGTISIADLDEETFAKIGSCQCDFYVNNSEELLTWKRLLEDQVADFFSIRGRNILLPVGRESCDRLEVLNCLISEDHESMTLFLKDTSDTTGLSASRTAVCNRFPGEEWYIAVLYQEQILMDREED